MSEIDVEIRDSAESPSEAGYGCEFSGLLNTLDTRGTEGEQQGALMVSTRSTKRRSRSPAAKVSEDRAKKVARKHGEHSDQPKLSFKDVKVILLDIGTLFYFETVIFEAPRSY